MSEGQCCPVAVVATYFYWFHLSKNYWICFWQLWHASEHTHPCDITKIWQSVPCPAIRGRFGNIFLVFPPFPSFFPKVHWYFWQFWHVNNHSYPEIASLVESFTSDTGWGLILNTGMSGWTCSLKQIFSELFFAQIFKCGVMVVLPNLNAREKK